MDLPITEPSNTIDFIRKKIKKQEAELENQQDQIQKQYELILEQENNVRD